MSVDGLDVSVDGLNMGRDSSSEFSGEHPVELGSVAGVMVSSEVSKSLVSSDGSKSHVLLNELCSGRLGGLE